MCTSAGEVCEAIHHLPFSFFLSLCHTSLLSLQCACCWVMWSLWPAFLSYHMQQPSATSGHDWSMPQLQWQLVISATSGHHSVHEYSVKKTTHVHLYKHIAQFVWLMVVLFSFFLSLPFFFYHLVENPVEINTSEWLWFHVNVSLNELYRLSFICIHFCLVNDLC